MPAACNILGISYGHCHTWTTRRHDFQLDYRRFLNVWYVFDADFCAKGGGLSTRIAPAAAANVQRFSWDTSVSEDTMRAEKGMDTCIGGAIKPKRC